MTELKLYKTTKKGLKIIAMSIPFVVIGIWMVNKEPFATTNYIMGWICICFFGLCIPIGLFHTFDKRPQIIISENGIWDRTTNLPEINWDQIVEAYQLDIYGQKFICLVTIDTFIPTKKIYKWASIMSEGIGAQKLNLSLGQINVDVNQLTDLINELNNVGKEERKTLIQSFKVIKPNSSTNNLPNILLYVFISISLLLLSLTGTTAFMTITIVMGLAAVTARWFQGSNDNSRIRKYAGIIAWLGFVNMVLLLLTFEAYDYTTENIGLKISTQIENYRNKFDTYPDNLELINKDINFNPIQKYFAGKIKYKRTENNYELQLNTLFNHDKIFNKDLKEWE